jgi:hypothetical protein
VTSNEDLTINSDKNQEEVGGKATPDTPHIKIRVQETNYEQTSAEDRCIALD